MEFIYNSNKQKIWFTSDTHFGHENIIRYCKRPFKNAAEMNEQIIQNWNALVGKDDIVFHLGDFGFGRTDMLQDVANQLNGHIHLLMGNHDWKHVKDGFFKRFETTNQQLRIRIDDYVIYLNHFPILCFDGAGDPARKKWQLFGHVHSGPLSKGGSDIPRLKMLYASQYDVGMDNNGYAPVSFEEVKEIIEKQQAAYLASKEGFLGKLYKSIKSIF